MTYKRKDMKYHISQKYELHQHCEFLFSVRNTLLLFIILQVILYENLNKTKKLDVSILKIETRCINHKNYLNCGWKYYCLNYQLLTLNKNSSILLT